MALSIQIYLLIGLLFAIAFFVVGHRHIDPTAADAKWTVRLLWLPAALALWPLLIWRWKQSSNTAVN